MVRHEPRRSSLSIEIYSKEAAKQKVDYIHFNPVSGKWLLAKDDLGYHFSSSRFYERGEDEFGFSKNIFHLFDGD
jgi:putative transposase